MNRKFHDVFNRVLDFFEAKYGWRANVDYFILPKEWFQGNYPKMFPKHKKAVPPAFVFPPPSVVKDIEKNEDKYRQHRFLVYIQEEFEKVFHEYHSTLSKYAIPLAFVHEVTHIYYPLLKEEHVTVLSAMLGVEIFRKEIEEAKE